MAKRIIHAEAEPWAARQTGRADTKMITRKEIEADVVRLIVTTREKFPHSVGWNEALKRVIWRYAGTARKPRRPKAKGPARRNRTTSP